MEYFSDADLFFLMNYEFNYLLKFSANHHHQHHFHKTLFEQYFPKKNSYNSTELQ